MAVEELVGQVPHDWEYITLGAVCERGGGDIQTGPFGSQLHAFDYVSVGIPSIMPQNIGDNRIIEDGIARITPADAKRLSRYLVRKGDIVYSRRGDVERRALVREHEDGWLCGTGCLRVRLGEKGVDSRYAYFYLGHPSVREWVVRHAHGATMPNLNTSLLAACPFVVPLPAEQRAIAHILGTLDDRIELNRRMSKTLEAMARAFFKSWFVDFDPVRAKSKGRDPGLPKPFADLFPARLVDSELGEIPEGWKVGSLFAQARLLSGGTPKTNRGDYWGGGIPWVSAKDVSQCNEWFLVDTERTITATGVAGSATQLIPELSTGIVARGATTGRMVLFGQEMAMNQTCYALVSTTGSPFALHCHLRYRIEDLVHAAHGSVFDTITTSTFTNSAFLLSPPSLLRVFERTVSPLFCQLLRNANESRTLAALRDTLLPKLISGELRVRDAGRLLRVT